MSRHSQATGKEGGKLEEAPFVRPGGTGGQLQEGQRSSGGVGQRPQVGYGMAMGDGNLHFQVQRLRSTGWRGGREEEHAAGSAGPTGAVCRCVGRDGRGQGAGKQSKGDWYCWEEGEEYD